MEFTENQARELASLLDVAALACGFAARRGCRPDESQWWPEEMALETPAVGEVQIHVTLDAAAAMAASEDVRCMEIIVELTEAAQDALTKIKRRLGGENSEAVNKALEIYDMHQRAMEEQFKRLERSGEVRRMNENE